MQEDGCARRRGVRGPLLHNLHRCRVCCAVAQFEEHFVRHGASGRHGKRRLGPSAETDRNPQGPLQVLCHFPHRFTNRLNCRYPKRASKAPGRPRRARPHSTYCFPKWHPEVLHCAKGSMPRTFIHRAMRARSAAAWSPAKGRRRQIDIACAKPKRLLIVSRTAGGVTLNPHVECVERRRVRAIMREVLL